jgi:hypothetical protein
MTQPQITTLAKTGTPPKRTPAEQRVLDLIAKDRGVEWVERNAALILEQAKALGEL